MNISFETMQRIHKAISIIESGEIDSLEPGRHELTDRIYVNVMEYETKTGGVFESHHQYIDIHYVITGSEIIETADEDSLDVTVPYHEEEDCVLGNAKGIRYTIPEKHRFLVLPGEAHLPGLHHGPVQRIRKAVIKVPVE